MGLMCAERRTGYYQSRKTYDDTGKADRHSIKQKWSNDRPWQKIIKNRTPRKTSSSAAQTLTSRNIISMRSSNFSRRTSKKSCRSCAFSLPRIFLEFTPEGNLEFRVEAEDQDYLFDEIGSGLKIRQYQREKKELLESLELFYRVVFLGDKIEDELGKEE